ncbi:hypothetical protein [Nocardioides insulae]|uniref:hypothetical protein n=1 Tax=Nocardioides insulae TaxID=394734 RepID=UPI0004133629|nr:hypothetical protein [Nocardioides insulae]
MSTTVRAEHPSSTDAGIRRTRTAAGVAAGVLFANVGIGFGDVEDHTTGLGLASELTAALAFLALAVALAATVPVTGWRALLWWSGPVGLTIAGLTMIGVPVVGAEPADWLFVLSVLPTLIGTVAAGVLGSRRIWPWPTGVGLALFLPIMFLAPLNSLWMALVCLGVLLTAGRAVDPASRWIPRRRSDTDAR